MRPEPTRAEAACILVAGTATDGIGTLGLAPIHLSQTTEFSTIRSAGAFTPQGSHLGLHISGSAMVTAMAAGSIISDRATVPAMRLVAVVLPVSPDTRIAFVAVVSAALAEAVSAAADSGVVVVASAQAVAEAAGSTVAEAAGSTVAEAAGSTVAEAAGSTVAEAAEGTAVRFPSRSPRGTGPARTDLPAARYGTAL